MANPDALADEGVSFADAMEYLHVRDRRGRLHAGGYAFLTLWDELPGYRRIAWLIRTLRLSAPFDRIYRRLSRGRYLKRCEAGVCFVEGKTLE
jgi:predicted DCC family thiol-disulfide oxidoreductase YuxK